MNNCKPRNVKDCWQSTRKLKEIGRLSYRFHRGHDLSNTLVSDLQPPECKTTNFCFLSEYTVTQSNSSRCSQAYGSAVQFLWSGSVPADFTCVCSCLIGQRANGVRVARFRVVLFMCVVADYRLWWQSPFPHPKSLSAVC